jgi:hypothetical protein
MSSDKNIFEQTAHLTDEQMLGYLRNNLSRQERHAVEKHLVDCSFCSDGLEGLKKMENESRFLNIAGELRRLARKRKPAVRRKIFSQLDLITLFVLIFLILFLIIVTVVMFWK